MKVLVIGSGGREHALVWKIKLSPKVEKVYCAPGNAGIGTIAECVAMKVDDFRALADFVKLNGIDLTVVGPEVPLCAGIVDFFRAENLAIFGPDRNAARLEGSKAFAKDLLKKYGIATADYHTFTSLAKAKKFLECWPADKPLVVKADGLAAGKGVIICRNPGEARAAVSQIIEKKTFGAAGKEVVVEEFLTGEEVSIQIFLDGTSYRIMAAAQDHKRAFDNDEGPNTGGMGTYAPAPIFSDALRDTVEKTILTPLIAGLRQEGIDYRGVLYLGLMVVKGVPYVLEFNCRFGDPETQVVLPLLKSDLVEIMENVVAGTLDKITVEWYNKAAVCVVLASKGYPGDYEKGKPITGIDEAEKKGNVVVFHAGTAEKDGTFLTAGGRVLGVMGIAATIRDAIKAAYAGVENIRFDGMHYRKDIAKRALNR
jgi:phosphoribosylamine--glycine ligase